MSKKAVVRFRSHLGRTQAFYLEHFGEPHFVYEFLTVLEKEYQCPTDEVPIRFAQLVGNFLGTRAGLYPWPPYDDLIQDNGVYEVKVDETPWVMSRVVQSAATPRWPGKPEEMQEKAVRAEREEAFKHPLILSGELRREIRDKNDRHFMRLQSVSNHAQTAK